jgi:uncharacterized protein YdeI (YjbR/CyaY-like superfamily)
MKLLDIRHREDWRAWLEEHHATETEVWLVYHKKHTGKPRVSYDEAVEEALCFGWIDSIVRKLDEDRFAQKFTPRKDRERWSELNLQRVERLIAAGRMTPAGLAKLASVPHAAPKRFEIGTEIPSFIAEALAANPTAGASFQRLAPSHRRNYIRWIIEAKKEEETRQRRLQEALQKLERNETLGLK